MKFVLAVVALHLALAIYLGVVLNIWADEACSIATTGGSLVHAVHQAVQFEWQPPGYFVVLWLWRQCHASILWARLLSTLCTALTIPLFFIIARRIANERQLWPYLATLVLAFHPYTIFAAVEIRLYAMGILLSVSQFDLFWRTYIEGQKSWRWWYLVVAILSLYVNILLGLTLAAQNIVLWISARSKEARQNFCMLAIAGSAYLPMFLLQLRSVKGKDIPGEALGFFKSFSFVAGSVVYDLGPIPRIESTLALRTVLSIVLIAIVAWIIRLYYREITPKQRVAWSYLATTAILLAVFLVATKLRANPRYTYPVLVASLLAWGQLSDPIRRQSIVVAIWSISLVFCIGTLVHDYRPLCKTGDWIRVTRFLESREEANQPIVVFISEVDTILRNYYRGPNLFVPVPGPQRMDRYRFADFDIPNDQAVQALLDPLLEQVDIFWLVTNEGAISFSPDGYHQEFLYTYLKKDFEILESTEFVDSKVSRLRRK